MAFTLNQLEALDKMIASGVLKTVYNGKVVEYRTMADLLRARETIYADLLAQGVITPTALTNRGPASLTVFSRE